MSSSNISEEDLEQIKAAKARIPFLTNLTEIEKDALAYMEDSRLPFIVKALEYAAKDPTFVPPLKLWKGETPIT